MNPYIKMKSPEPLLISIYTFDLNDFRRQLRSGRVSLSFFFAYLLIKIDQIGFLREEKEHFSFSDERLE